MPVQYIELPAANRGKMPADVATVLGAVASYYGVAEKQILGPSRLQNIAFVRHVAMYLARRRTRHSFEQLATHFCRFDHTTVLHAVKRIERLLQSDELLRAQISEIQGNLGLPRRKGGTNGE